MLIGPHILSHSKRAISRYIDMAINGVKPAAHDIGKVG